MATTNAQRIRIYKEKMRRHCFKRLTVYVHDDLFALLGEERKPYECNGRTLERLLLGESRKRPPVR